MRVRAALVASLVLAVAIAAPASACRVMKMKNKTGQVVNDLHFVTNMGDVDFSFANLAANDSINITITAATDCDKIRIRKWWWTKDGKNNVIGGVQNGEPKCYISIGGGNAAGNGRIRVHVDGVDHDFLTTPGDPPTITTQKLMAFLATLQDAGRAEVTVQNFTSTSVDFVGNDLGDPAVELVGALPSQDSGQSINVLMSTVVPGTSTLGLAALALALALAGLGATLIARRRSVAA